MLVKKKIERESVREKWKKRYLNLAKAQAASATTSSLAATLSNNPSTAAPSLSVNTTPTFAFRPPSFSFNNLNSTSSSFPDSASSTYIQCLNRSVASASSDLNLLESMSFGTVSFEELLGHCNEVYKNSENRILDIQDRLRSFGYVPAGTFIFYSVYYLCLSLQEITKNKFFFLKKI